MENNKYPHLMIDLETMGQGSNAVICSLAAVPFHMDGRIGQPFTQNIDIQSCLDAGLQVTGDTIYWWLEQSKEARISLFPNRKPLPQVLINLISFIGFDMQEGFKIWGKGPSFDISILADAYRICKINIPWKYSNERCVRTAIDGHEAWLKENLPNLGIRHDAEADALHQAEQVQITKNEMWPKRDSRTNRRYKLHYLVKKFTKMNAYKKEVYVNRPLLEKLNKRDKRYLNELRQKYGYNIQYIIHYKYV